MRKNFNDIYEETTLIFVYGSLKRGYQNESFLYEAKSLGKAKTLHKYPLIINKSEYYPYLIDKKGFGYEIIGELYRIKKEFLFELDRFEGSEFRRKKVKVQKKSLRQRSMDLDDCVEANIYYYKKDIDYYNYDISWAWSKKVEFFLSEE